MQTPDWIQQIMDAHNGGHFYPILLGLSHPLITENWVCLYCNRHFSLPPQLPLFSYQETAFVMPLHGVFESTWTACHKTCAYKVLFRGSK